MSITLHENDIPEGLDFGASVALDTETMGLNPARDRLCMIQLSSGDGHSHLVKFTDPAYDAPNLKALLASPDVEKIIHYARFDIGVLKKYLGVDCRPVFCTKIASKLVRTYTDKHGLRNLCKELLNVEISKQYQSSDWGAPEISEEQKTYAANDVIYLHRIKRILSDMLLREGRMDMAQACFGFLQTRAALDLAGWADTDIFEH